VLKTASNYNRISAYQRVGQLVGLTMSTR